MKVASLEICEVNYFDEERGGCQVCVDWRTGGSLEWRFGGFRIISRFVAEHKKKEHLTPIKPDKRFDMVEIEKRKIGYLETIDEVAPESKK
ncbi:MAG: hypothetical protein NTX75_01245 [Proteobacteria bacterium]|nr:hypothetical protein [Pseudomonadota bacterium]